MIHNDIGATEHIYVFIFLPGIFKFCQELLGKAGHEYGIPVGWNGLIHGKPAGNATHGSELSPDPSQNGSE